MKYCFLILFVHLMFSSGCKNTDSVDDIEYYFVLDSMIKAIEMELSPLQQEIKNLSNHSEVLFGQQDAIVDRVDKSKYIFSDNNVFHNPKTTKKESTVYISTFTDNIEESIRQVYFTEPMDSLFFAIMKNNPMVCQVYYNSRRQFSRVYPPYDIFSSIETNMDITSFNFYYLADELRNPEKSYVWLDEVYVDPVGRGWILSLIHPVYHDDRLEGVLGLDITLSDLMKNFLDKSNKKLFIIDGQGTIVAGKDEAIEALSMPPLKNHTYVQTVNSNNFRKEDFNLFKSKSKEVRRMASKFLLEKENEFSSKTDNFPFHAYCMQMNMLNWYLIELD